MKADAEGDEVQQKVQGTAVGWKGIRVVPLIAAVPHDSSHPLVASVLQATDDLSAALPAASGIEAGELVIGTLDVNFGATLPAEELVGSLPKASPHRKPTAAYTCSAPPLLCALDGGNFRHIVCSIGCN